MSWFSTVSCNFLRPKINLTLLRTLIFKIILSIAAVDPTDQGWDRNSWRKKENMNSPISVQKCSAVLSDSVNMEYTNYEYGIVLGTLVT